MTDASALDAALDLLVKVRVGPECWFRRQPEDVQAVLTKHFARDLSDATLAIQVKPFIPDITPGKVGWHRRGKCSCPPKT